MTHSIAADFFQSHGYHLIHRRVLSCLDGRDAVRLAGVCRALRAMVKASHYTKLRIATQIFNTRPADVDLDDAQRTDSELYERYLEMENAKSNLSPRHVGLFYRHLLGGHDVKQGYYMCGVSRSRHDWDDDEEEFMSWEESQRRFEPDDWNGQLIYDIVQLAPRYDNTSCPIERQDDSTSSEAYSLWKNPPDGVGVLRRWRMVISHRMDMAHDWDPVQDVFAIVTYHHRGYAQAARGDQKGEIVIRLYKLSPNACPKDPTEPYEAEPHPSAYSHIYSIPDQRIHGVDYKLRIGPGGLLALYSGQSIWVLDWQKGCWMGCFQATGIRDIRFSCASTLSVLRLINTSNRPIIALDSVRICPDSHGGLQSYPHRSAFATEEMPLLQLSESTTLSWPGLKTLDFPISENDLELHFLETSQRALDVSGNDVKGFAIEANTDTGDPRVNDSSNFFIDPYPPSASKASSDRADWNPTVITRDARSAGGYYHLRDICATIDGNCLILLTPYGKELDDNKWLYKLERYEVKRRMILKKTFLNHEMSLLRHEGEGGQLKPPKMDDISLSPKAASLEMDGLVSIQDASRITLDRESGPLVSAVDLAIDKRWTVCRILNEQNRLFIILEPELVTELSSEHNAEPKPVIVLDF